jgi:DNA-directed RNA polymerase subunit N (RpoN/RPB10)
MAYQPLVCIACGLHLGDAFSMGRDLVQDGFTRGEALDYLNITRMCCVSTFISFYPNFDGFREIVQHQHIMRRLADGHSTERPTVHQFGTNFHMYRAHPQVLDFMPAPKEPIERVRERERRAFAAAFAPKAPPEPEMGDDVETDAYDPGVYAEEEECA